MKPSLTHDHPLPENADEARYLAEHAEQNFGRCITCNLHLSDPNAASTRAGWLETQISGTCGPCFDALFDESEGDHE